MLQIVSAPLAATGPAAHRGSAWYREVPRGPAAWGAALRDVARPDDSWRRALEPALGGDAGGAAAIRLRAASAVVTTGQQPGLFGGPLYTLHKALTALALADALEAATGERVAPVFWAATDDTDFAEAAGTWVLLQGTLRELRLAGADHPGTAMAATPLGPTGDLLDALAAACGSAADARVLDIVRAAYAPPATVGGAYVALLRALLSPLGITVLDAAHPAVRRAGEATLRAALRRAAAVGEALAARDRALRAAGVRAQVSHVPHLSLVFATGEDGTRARVRVDAAPALAEQLAAERLGPNVLLRPVLERAILPTVAYVAGPGELAYFAQVSAVAGALDAPVPRAVPRWSGTVIEPHAAAALASVGATLDALEDPHALERRVAREGIAPAVGSALQRLRAAVATELASAASVAPDAALARSVRAGEVAMTHRLDRLERRFAAEVKRRGNAALTAVALARAALRPGGAPQERVLAFAPFLSRYGRELTDGVLAAATPHVAEIVGA